MTVFTPLWHSQSTASSYACHLPVFDFLPGRSRRGKLIFLNAERIRRRNRLFFDFFSASVDSLTEIERTTANWSHSWRGERSELNIPEQHKYGRDKWILVTSKMIFLPVNNLPSHHSFSLSCLEMSHSNQDRHLRGHRKLSPSTRTFDLMSISIDFNQICIFSSLIRVYSHGAQTHQCKSPWCVGWMNDEKNKAGQKLRFQSLPKCQHM